MEGLVGEDYCPPRYKHRASLATQWQNILIARRIAKDRIMQNQPIIDFLDSDVGKKTINQLRQVLGKMRKTEKDMGSRIYHVRETNLAPVNPVIKEGLDKMIRERKANHNKKENDNVRQG